MPASTGIPDCLRDDYRAHLVFSCELQDLMLQLGDLVMLGQVGRPQPAALLLQLIQLVLHMVPLLLHHMLHALLHALLHA